MKVCLRCEAYTSIIRKKEIESLACDVVSMYKDGVSNEEITTFIKESDSSNSVSISIKNKYTTIVINSVIGNSVFISTKNKYTTIVINSSVDLNTLYLFPIAVLVFALLVDISNAQSAKIKDNLDIDEYFSINDFEIVSKKVQSNNDCVIIKNRIKSIFEKGMAKITKTICVYRPKDGVEKAVLSLNLAGVASRMGLKVLIVEFDIHAGSLSIVINEEINRTMYHFAGDLLINRYK
ncbi:hypothetical protein PIROE2DRAFT_8373 [Piromyces sp. E2]|nr:hypothetical protein PIROE2DRAFT_8373 [Piromyces sp. E2]|eukprot:OUM64761.1 hypothetical protein PIROE2DRAFT_8373 [Piromyces sp. E2]